MIGFLPQAGFEAFPLFVQIAVAAIAAFFAWALIHRSQKRAAEESRRIERAKLLHELDHEYAAVMAKRCVLIASGRPPPRVNEADLCVFELALTRNVVWLEQVDREALAPTEREYHLINGARAVRVGRTGDGADCYVDTLTLHQVVAWSKRVANACEARIVDRRDIADMWRNVLPWARTSRFSFMADFFGVSEENLGAFRDPTRPRVDFSIVTTAFAGRQGRIRITSRPPRRWSGDIAPLYRLITIATGQAIRHKRAEMLDYLGLLNGTTSPDVAKLDPLIRKVMLGAQT